MKTLIQIVCLGLTTFVSASALASGDLAPTPSTHGHTECRAYDVHSEEHGNHLTCSECLAKHNKCEIRCFDPEYTAVAIGTDVNGSRVEVPGKSYRSPYEAKNDALQRCRLGRRLAECDVDDSRSQSDNRLVSTERCL